MLFVSRKVATRQGKPRHHKVNACWKGHSMLIDRGLQTTALLCAHSMLQSNLSFYRMLAGMLPHPLTNPPVRMSTGILMILSGNFSARSSMLVPPSLCGAQHMTAAAAAATAAAGE
jgi:hypothetical protein